jgi:hypothetical protein
MEIAKLLSIKVRLAFNCINNQELTKYYVNSLAV